MENAVANVDVGCLISIQERLSVKKAIPIEVENLGIHTTPVFAVAEQTVRAVHGGHHERHEDDTFEGSDAHMSIAFTEQVDITTTKSVADAIRNMQVQSSLETEQRWVQSISDLSYQEEGNFYIDRLNHF